MREQRFDAYAKLTLSLHVTGVRDDGYHELDALMVSITAPFDSVAIADATATSLEITGPFAAGVPDDASNLAWRAADACGRPLAIRIHKGIPNGAGLGGGSADAAAVLVACGADPSAGLALGADVPFCMRGGAAHVRGIGEMLEPVDVPTRIVVVATPPFRCATADVYRAWDSLGGPSHPDNDLEPAAFAVEPRLVAFKRAIEDAAGAPAVLAGSGSSFAVLFDHNVEADAARRRIEAAVDATVWVGATTDAGVVRNR